MLASLYITTRLLLGGIARIVAFFKTKPTLFFRRALRRDFKRYPIVSSRRALRWIFIREQIFRSAWLLSWAFLLAWIIVHMRDSLNKSDYFETSTAIFGPAIAGVSTTFAGIVAVFLAFASEQSQRMFTVESAEAQYRRQWYGNLFRVTRINGLFSITSLLLNAVIAILSLGEVKNFVTDPRLASRLLNYGAIGGLIFGFSCFALQLSTLVVQETEQLEPAGPTQKSIVYRVPWSRYIVYIVRIMTIEVILLMLLLLEAVFVKFTTQRHPELLFDFLVILVLPIMLATGVTLLASRGYRRLWTDRFFRKWGEHAGLGLVLTQDRKVLLNRQNKDPFQGMWLIPGGYRNKEEDLTLQGTVKRRIIKIAGENGVTISEKLLIVLEDSLLATPKMYKNKDKDKDKNKGKDKDKDKDQSEGKSQSEDKGPIDFDPEYVEAALEYNYAPTFTYLFRVTKLDSYHFEESDIDTTASFRWWSVEEIKNLENGNQIPRHLRELLLAVLEVETDKTKLWDVRSPARQGGT